MTFDEIETFLSIVNIGSITKAAKELCITQATVTQRLKNLENELGVPLIDRGRGIKKIELTAEGHDFLYLANNWQSLKDEIDSFKRKKLKLSIAFGSVQMMNEFYFRDMFADILKKHPDFKLDIYTEHAVELLPLVEQRVIDFAIGWRPSTSPNLICEPWKEEPLVIVRRSRYTGQNSIAIKDLDPSKELYINWPVEFKIWHDALWPQELYHPPFITNTNTALSIIAETDRWAFMPLFYAKIAQKQGDFNYLYPDQQPPTMTAYKIMHANPRPNVQRSLEFFTPIFDSYSKEIIKKH